jgi:carboxymethylenebutenolidase
MRPDISKKVYVGHRGVFRRQILLKPAALAVCAFAAGMYLLGSPAVASPRPPQDANAETVQYDSGGTSISAYLVKPSGSGKHPAVLLVHDNQGLTDGVRDLARQFAAAGFLTLAPDLASRAGGSKSPQQAQGALNQMQGSAQIDDLSAGFAYLQKDPDVDASKISSVGFGWGGWRTLKLASAVPELYRAVVYCGATPNEGLATIKAPVMANYAQYDFRVTGGAIPTEKELKSMGKKFTYYVYPNTDRAFFNPANPRYDAEAAKQAWGRTVDFLQASM